MTIPVRALAATAALAAALTASTAAAAAAAAAAPSVHAPTRFVIHERIDHPADLWTFTASTPLCPSGTFRDDVTVLAQSPDMSIALWSVDTTFTCDSGDSFTAHKLLVRRVDAHGATNRGTVRFTGGTGAFVHLSGHGRDVGASVDGQAAGTITGRLRGLD